METDSEVRHDLRAFGICVCGELWAKTTGVWCEICPFTNADGAIDLCYLASGFGIVTDGHTRRIVRGGSVWCGAPSRRRDASIMLAGNSRFFGMRLEPPGNGSGWCGMDSESAARAWQLLKDRAVARPLSVSPGLEASWRELLVKLESPDAEGAAAAVCMAFGSLVRRCLDEMARTEPSASGAKSSESVLAHLETCDIRKVPTIEKLAARLGYCSGRLMVSFRASFGVTLKQCMDMIRCEQAVRLVRAGATVQEMAAACGFGGLVAFRKTFARQFGMSVNDYRRKIGVKAK